jgi:hypothetical protein
MTSTGSSPGLVAADDLPARAADLAGPVRADGQRPAQLVQHHVMMPPAIVLQVRKAGPAAAGPVDDMVRLAARGGLVAAAEAVAATNPPAPLCRWEYDSSPPSIPCRHEYRGVTGRCPRGAGPLPAAVHDDHSQTVENGLDLQT